MPAPIQAWLNAILLIVLCFALPYGLHLERELRASSKALTKPDPEVSTSPTPSALPDADADAEPDTAEPRAVSVPPSPEATLLEEARRRAAADPAEAMVWLQEQTPDAARLQAMLEVVALWASEDAESALLWLESNAHGLARSETLKNGVTLWSEADPLSAAAWIDGMASDGSKDIAAAALAESWGQQDPIRAAAWVESIPAGPSRRAAANALLNAWSAQDPVSAADWAAREALQGSTEALEHCLSRISERDPVTAEGLLRNYFETFPQAPLLESYLQSFTRTDPARAAKWLDTLSADDPLKNEAASRTLLQEWSRNDSVAASVWLSKQAPGPQRDAAIIGFVQSIKTYAPEAAVTWSNAMTDPQARMRNLAESLESWSANDPLAAAAWLQAAELEPDLRKELSWVIQQ